MHTIEDQETKTYTPRIYETYMDVRVADLDAHGHVNARNYIDFVSSSRLKFQQEVLNFSPSELMSAGAYYFIRKSLVEYKRPILPDALKIYVKSFVKEIRRYLLVVPFEIWSADAEFLHAKGELEFATIDIKTHKPTEFPKSLYKHIYM